MLIRAKQLRGMREGSVTCAFRCWKRPTVKAGGSLKTAVGVLAIDAVEIFARSKLTSKDASLAGYDTLAELRAELDSRTGTLYRIQLHFEGTDPRIKLRKTSKLSKQALGDVLSQLDRMDARSKSGPWTQSVLELIRERPAVRAPDLALSMKRDTLPFKRDVRKLKELGLTESLEVGYRLSPRGVRVIRALEDQE